MAETQPKKAPYKWIAKRIESLDPHKDYEEIYRLSSSYNLSDFMNNMMYGLIFPNFVVTPQGSKAVWREDGGKVLHKSSSRVEGTETNNMTWWYYGPSDKRCQDSIEGINRLHERQNKMTPGLFYNNEDFVYTLVFSTVIGDRFPRLLGLPGYTEKQKIAAHLFWQEASKYFVSIPEEGKRLPLYDYPKSWDEAMAYAEEVENRPWPTNERGNLIAEGIFQQFAYRWFPPGLRTLGRAIPVSLSLPTTIKAHGVEDVHPITRVLVIWFVGTALWLLSFMPDPAPGDVYIEKLRNAPKEEKIERVKYLADFDKKFCPYFAANNKDKWANAPLHAKLADYVEKQGN